MVGGAQLIAELTVAYLVSKRITTSPGLGGWLPLLLFDIKAFPPEA